MRDMSLKVGLNSIHRAVMYSILKSLLSWWPPFLDAPCIKIT